MRDHAVKNLVRASVAMLAIATIALAAAGILFVNATTSVRELKLTVDTLSAGNAPVSTKARQDRAETRFILYTRSAEILDPDDLEDLGTLCEGYDTLVEAYETQGVPAP